MLGAKISQLWDGVPWKATAEKQFRSCFRGGLAAYSFSFGHGEEMADSCALFHRKAHPSLPCNWKAPAGQGIHINEIYFVARMRG